MGRQPGLCNKATGISEHRFIADGESLVLRTPLRSRVRGEGIIRQEKVAGLGLCKAGNKQGRVRGERAGWIEGTGNECLGRVDLAEGEGS